MKMKAILKNQKGSSAVEFALILPLLTLVIFGIIEFGLLLYNQQVITNASREGARAGIIVGLDRSANEHETVSRTTASNYCSNHLVTFSGNSSPLLISTPPPSAVFSGDEFTVTVSYLYDFLVLSSLGFGPVTLDAKTIMKLE
jgi:Flp pilus assembly protein TadG